MFAWLSMGFESLVTQQLRSFLNPASDLQLDPVDGPIYALGEIPLTRTLLGFPFFGMG
jgi:hypothetical protein